METFLLKYLILAALLFVARPAFASSEVITDPEIVWIQQAQLKLLETQGISPEEVI